MTPSSPHHYTDHFPSTPLPDRDPASLPPINYDLLAAHPTECSVPPELSLTEETQTLLATDPAPEPVVKPGDVLVVGRDTDTRRIEFVTATTRPWRLSLYDLERDISGLFSHRPLQKHLSKPFALYRDPYDVVPETLPDAL